MYLAGTSKLDTHPTRGKASNKFGLHVNIINIMVFELTWGSPSPNLTLYRLNN
jgi:hypothetical protein